MRNALSGKLDSSSTLATILLAGRSPLKFGSTHASHGRTSLDPIASHDGTSRRIALSTVLAASFAPGIAHAKRSEAELVEELKSVQALLEPLPAMLDQEKWDAVRTVLKNPPVGNLWNLGESKNTLRLLGDAREDIDMIESADELSNALQMADQYTYDNNFIYFQPGNGKINIKAPKDMIAEAQKRLNDALAK
eukprot:CAMPEP_0169079164 /NCGR_PEP_ID=MMETSP1015-20121227/9799_1 /TAXON_ID=342587 /ORGANISM="Karlodinium micrum, Strain CCMP2283" /LENGTH=192 /DNA_ID=CAMNT_0009138803 /DNA_START=136 /DNA_END=714 /DNA_ORIENTATION=+